jgi:hypothetical protein
LKIRTKVNFAGVPKGTTGIAEPDEDVKGIWKITWEQGRHREIEDFFNQREFDQYLEKI